MQQQLFFPILDGLTGGKVDLSLRIEKHLKHTKSIEKDWGKMQLSHSIVLLALVLLDQGKYEAPDEPTSAGRI